MVGIVALLLLIFTSCFDSQSSERLPTLRWAGDPPATAEVGAEVELEVTPSDYASRIDRYLWSINDSTLDERGARVRWTPESSGDYRVSVSARMQSGSVSDSISTSITAFSSGVPVASIEAPSTAELEEIVTFTATNRGDGDIDSVFWSLDGEKRATGASSIEWSFNTLGSKEIRAQILNSEGNRSDEAIHSITITEQSYHLHRGIMASTFWTGQGAGDDNHHISNVPSAWDSDWGGRYGLEDSPTLKRDANFFPTDSRFSGDENPYYFALPYNDYDRVVFDGLDASALQKVISLHSNYVEGTRRYDNRKVAMVDSLISYKGAPRKPSVNMIPWRNDRESWSGRSIVKGRWARIRYNGGDWVYAQWLDAGPYHYDDFEYVFGTARPRNEKGSDMSINPHAGIDISPAVWLKMEVEQSFFDSWGGKNDYVDWQFVNDDDVPDGPWKIHVSDNITRW